MNIFNQDKSKNNQQQKDELDDYELRLEERKEEYKHLNEILRGMRSEVSRLMEDIKTITDELVKKNAERFLLEQQIDELKRSYNLLAQDVKYEQENFSKLTEELNKIRNEIKENLIYSEKLKESNNELENISEKLDLEKLELEQIIDKSTALIDEEINHLKKTKQVATVSGKKVCIAKTKSGKKCKRLAIEGSDYCSSHLPK